MRLALLAVVLLVGCGTSAPRIHAVSVTSEPSGAYCTVTNSSVEPITQIEATPATIQLPVSPRDVRVFCTRPGYEPGIAALPAEADAGKMALMTAAGGVSGLAFASLSGQAYRYAPAVHVTLAPITFPSQVERDRYFAARVVETRGRYDPQIRVHRSMCRPDEVTCQHTISEMEKALRAELAQLEQARSATDPR